MLNRVIPLLTYIQKKAVEFADYPSIPRDMSIVMFVGHIPLVFPKIANTGLWFHV